MATSHWPSSTTLNHKSTKGWGGGLRLQERPMWVIWGSQTAILCWLVTTQFSSSLVLDTSTVPANLAALPLPTSWKNLRLDTLIRFQWPHTLACPITQCGLSTFQFRVPSCFLTSSSFCPIPLSLWVIAWSYRHEHPSEGSFAVAHSPDLHKTGTSPRRLVVTLGRQRRISISFLVFLKEW